MSKKTYQSPQMEAVSIQHEVSLLTASQVLVGGEVGAPALPPVDAEALHDRILEDITGIPDLPF